MAFTISLNHRDEVGLKCYADAASLFEYTDMLVSSATVLLNYKTSAVSHGTKSGFAMLMRHWLKVKMIENH
jgi:hypothetical protein